MQSSATFNFFGALQDLLPAPLSYSYMYNFNGSPAIKDAIEAIGIPHTEVNIIRVNDMPANFNYQLQNGDRADVYPHHSHLSAQLGIDNEVLVNNGFIVDVHLGTLARTMRLLGFDTLYNNQYTEAEVASLASLTKRIVITRSRHLLKHNEVQCGYWIRSHQMEQQIGEVMHRFNLKNLIQPFKRCVMCNGLLMAVGKQQIIEMLPPKTRQYFNDFWQCNGCGRVYWKGSHYDRMQLLIESIRSTT